MSVQSLLHAKNFSDFNAAAKKLLNNNAASLAEVDEAKKTHPGNPANATASTAPATAATAQPVATNGSMPADKAGLLVYLASHPAEIAAVATALARLEVPVSHSPANTTALVCKNGKVFGVQDVRPFRLCRRAAGKADLVYIGVLSGKAVKGKGIAGSINVAVPVLEAMANDGYQTAALALAAYSDGTICYSRERE